MNDKYVYMIVAGVVGYFIGKKAAPASHGIAAGLTDLPMTGTMPITGTMWHG